MSRAWTLLRKRAKFFTKRQNYSSLFNYLGAGCKFVPQERLDCFPKFFNSNYPRL